jgi:uncharacterized protein
VTFDKTRPGLFVGIPPRTGRSVVSVHLPNFLPTDAPIPAPSPDLPPLRRAVGVRFAVAVVLAAGLVVLVDLPRQFALVTGSGALALAAALVGSALGLIVYRWIIARAELREVTEVAGPGAVRELSLGLAGGTGLLAVTMGVLVAVGAYRIGTGSFDDGLGAMAAAVAGAVGQEIAIRGLIYRVLEEALGTWLSLLGLAVLLGALHFADPDGTTLGSVAVAVEGALLLGAAYVLTRRLWFAIGIHVAWSVWLTAVFGARGEVGFLASEQSGAQWLSGGAGGAEVSVVAIVVTGAATAWMLVQAVRSERIVAPMWRRGRPEHTA